MEIYPPVWYHGSPALLTFLLPGSTITQNRHLAEIFSHKPMLVCISDEGTIQHNGTAKGLLYQIAEVVRPEDVLPHPRTSMPPGYEWLTTRELRVTCLGPVEIHESELLSEEEVRSLLNRIPTETQNPSKSG